MVHRHNIDPVACLECGRTINLVVSRHNRRPMEGDIVVCVSCGTFMVWQKNELKQVGDVEMGAIRKTPFYQEILAEIRKLG